MFDDCLTLALDALTQCDRLTIVGISPEHKVALIKRPREIRHCKILRGETQTMLDQITLLLVLLVVAHMLDVADVGFVVLRGFGAKSLNEGGCIWMVQFLRLFGELETTFAVALAQRLLGGLVLGLCHLASALTALLCRVGAIVQMLPGEIVLLVHRIPVAFGKRLLAKIHLLVGLIVERLATQLLRLHQVADELRFGMRRLSRLHLGRRFRRLHLRLCGRSGLCRSVVERIKIVNRGLCGLRRCRSGFRLRRNRLRGLRLHIGLGHGGLRWLCGSRLSLLRDRRRIVGFNRLRNLCLFWRFWVVVKKIIY